VAGELNLDQISSVTLPHETLNAIVRQHGLKVHSIREIQSTGVVNAVFSLDDVFVLRVPVRNNPDAIRDTLTESVAAPAAFRTGVRTPRLVVFDDSRGIIDFPYTIYERVNGTTLGLLDEPATIHHAWIALGRDLAKLHREVTHVDDPLNYLDQPRRMDLRAELDGLASGGVLISSHARWLGRWLERLAPAAFTTVTPRFLHNDLQATNIIVGHDSHEYQAMIDWGDAGWGDPALELQWVDFRAVPFVMKGYREVRPFDGEETIEARVLWDQIMNLLHQLTHSVKTGRFRASYAVEILRFVLANRDPRFREWFLEP
jgi:macrolide phosphotransferase